MNFIKSLKKLLTLQNVLFILACLFTVNIICNNNININEGLQNNSDPSKTLFLVFIILIIIAIVLVASQNKLR